MGKRRKHKHPSSSELAKFKNDLISEFSEKGHKVSVQENVGEKMSDVLENFIEPYRQYANSLVEYQRLIATAIMAWNASLVKGKERKKMLEEMFIAIAPDGNKQTRDDFFAIVGDMIKRKEQFFADNQRYIVHFEVQETRKGFHLSVASLVQGAPTG